MSIPFVLLPPRKKVERMSLKDSDVEGASLKAGICIRIPNLGHFHIGAPLHGESRVPVHQVFDGEGIVRYSMKSADAAAFLSDPELGSKVED